MSTELVEGYQVVSEEPQQKEQNLNEIYADIAKEEKVMNVISQINPENILIDIEHRIRGEKKDPFTKEWVPISKTQKPISEELIANFMSFLGAHLNQNVSMANFSPTEINNIMDIVINYVKSDLSVNAHIYHIKGDYPEMTRIGDIVCMQVYAVLKQAMNGMLSKRIFASLRMNENMAKPPSKIKSALGDLVPW